MLKRSSSRSSRSSYKKSSYKSYYKKTYKKVYKSTNTYTRKKKYYYNQSYGSYYENADYSYDDDYSYSRDKFCQFDSVDCDYINYLADGDGGSPVGAILFVLCCCSLCCGTIGFVIWKTHRKPKTIYD